jgi:hypothetical protein
LYLSAFGASLSAARVTRLDEFSFVGRFFVYWAINFFGQFFENSRHRLKNVYFFLVKSDVLILQKSDLSYILGYIFSQTHLVTLLAAHTHKYRRKHSSGKGTGSFRQQHYSSVIYQSIVFEKNRISIHKYIQKSKFQYADKIVN